MSFCSNAVVLNDLLVVPDTLADERFQDNPFVSDEPRPRFYAGAPIRSQQGLALGTLCVLDAQPGSLDPRQRERLKPCTCKSCRKTSSRKSS